METLSLPAVMIEDWSDIRELALMSIGTDKGRWWAAPAFGSDLWKLRQEGKITGRTAAAVRQLILEALAWLKADGLVRDIDCRAEQSGRDTITYTVTVTRPNGNPVTIKEVWNAV